MESICFTVPGKPQGKARARTFYNPKTKGMSSMTPEKTVLYENLIATCYLQEAGDERFSDDAYLKVRIQAFYEIPKSSTKTKKAAMAAGEILPDKKPDIDNIAKAVLDALNEVAYRDDTQVVELQMRKKYSDRPRLEICIEELEV
ncbi:MAG: RusA family crossover junction endodeoxyribonuclease [Blautia sp.]|nr:RusA family crossover junction endodeoxyribonuclease [Blautia sp.]